MDAVKLFTLLKLKHLTLDELSDRHALKAHTHNQELDSKRPAEMTLMKFLCSLIHSKSNETFHTHLIINLHILKYFGTFVLSRRPPAVLNTRNYPSLDTPFYLFA